LTLFKYFGKHKLPLILSIIYIMLQNISFLAIPWILKLAIDNIQELVRTTGSTSPDTSAVYQLMKYSAMLLAVSAIGGIFRFYMRRLLIGVSRKIEYSLRADLFSHLQSMDSSFFINNKTGSIMALVTNDLDAVRNFLGPGLLNLFSTIFSFASTLIVMFLINVKLTLYSLIAIPLLPVIVSQIGAMMHKRFKISQEHYAFLSARTQENVAGIKVVKSFALEKNEISLFSELNSEYIIKNMALAKVRSVFWPIMIFIGGIGSLLVLWVGGRQVISGQLTLGQFVQFSSYIVALTWPLISLGWVINLIQRGDVSMARLNNLFNTLPLIRSATGSIIDTETLKPGPKPGIRKKTIPEDLKNNPAKISGDIVFKDVCFKFFEDRKDWILKDINLEIKEQSKIGIVGFTGSGKTALVNLIPRLYDPQKGRVSIGRAGIRNVPIETLRNSIGYVTQDTFIFSKTVRENIIFGKEQYFDDAGINKSRIEDLIVQASKAAHLHEDVLGFPEGYETLVGERGIMISGGQKQRLAIARALIMMPSILILDDSFSNVDTQTEELILKDLKKITEKLTTIIISHRISTIRNSDLIIVIDDGEIKETGTHRDLIKSCSLYQKLYARQQLSEEE
jgi:ATP-binding cassette, subfamily B, multidrug efflux pump